MNKREGCGLVAWGSALLVLVVIVGTGLVFWDLGLSRIVLPAQAQIQRDVTVNSKSYQDGANIALNKDIQAWNETNAKAVSLTEKGQTATAQAYISQRDAIMDGICQRFVTMPVDTVAPSTLAFVAKRGGCN